VIEDANGSHREYCKRIDMLQTWMCQRQLPRQLRHKLETYFEILFPGGHAFDDSEILSSLSSPLLEEVSRHKCRALLKQLDIDWEVYPSLARRLSSSLERVIFVGGDDIVKEGDPSRAMYFINSGAVHVLIRALGAEPIKTLHANDGMSSLFGEMALLSPDGRAVATIRVPPNGYCDAFELHASHFRELCVIYPSFRRNIERVHVERNRETEQHGVVRRTSDGTDEEEKMRQGMWREVEGAIAPAAAPAPATAPRSPVSWASVASRPTRLTSQPRCTAGALPPASDAACSA